MFIHYYPNSSQWKGASKVEYNPIRETEEKMFKHINKETFRLQAVDQFDFLDHRRQQQKLHWSKQLTGDPLDSILTVEINTTELCNGTCVFCPRHDPTSISQQESPPYS